ncbi:uncharacterized protein LOC127809785 isoform X3 [Diospyros lotus]|uniref:uncharacterized protein LOC127809785 isoform X3 n=1 Tax=Diospyros lotus TaxID=55363 RepID=UPI00225984EC|nr:uncharacterized protein LOC127809785 isoform X3 [Diospyros lotus]
MIGLARCQEPSDSYMLKVLFMEIKEEDRMWATLDIFSRGNIHEMRRGNESKQKLDAYISKLTERKEEEDGERSRWNEKGKEMVTGFSLE